MFGKSKKFTLLVFGFLVFSNTLAWIAVFEFSESQFLRVFFFDVGQGDAIFIITPQGHQILIDGGPDSTVLEKLGQAMPFWDRSIDLIVLTHPEQDHISGLIEVLKRYKIDYVLWTGVVRDTSEYKKWVSLLENQDSEIVMAEVDRRVKAGKVLLDVLYPFENLEGQSINNTNNTSIILRLVFGKTSFLFTGDAYKSVERKLVREALDNESFVVTSDILKIGHHGSKTSSVEDFLVVVEPEIAVISLGGDPEAEGENCDNQKRNRYKHPSCEVLANLQKYGIKVLRTDEQGDIKISSDGRNFKFKIQNESQILN